MSISAKSYHLQDRSKNISFSSNKDPDREASFTAIFREHEYKLHMLALRLTKSDQYAKDIIQEVFLKLWAQWDRIREIENMEAWLYRLTENKVVDFLRKVSADTRLKQAIWHNLHEIINEPQAQVEAKECSQIIQKAIDQLPPQRRIIYRLNRERGMNYREIAGELHLSRHTVKNQLSSALRSIRSFITNSMK
jgi:RNA polymerase sigma-70 factor (family 1)